MDIHFPGKRHHETVFRRFHCKFSNFDRCIQWQFNIAIIILLQVLCITLFLCCSCESQGTNPSQIDNSSGRWTSEQPGLPANNPINPGATFGYSSQQQQQEFSQQSMNSNSKSMMFFPIAPPPMPPPQQPGHHNEFPPPGGNQGYPGWMGQSGGWTGPQGQAMNGGWSMPINSQSPNPHHGNGQWEGAQRPVAVHQPANK